MSTASNGIPDLKKNVSDVRSNAPVKTVEREVKAEQHNTPEFQSTFQDLAKSQNNLSAIGAGVAQSASNQMAAQLGYESGKNPHGDLLPPLTEFDKNFAASYHNQAAATLSLQGEKLLTDAHIEMSKPNRLNPQLIENTTRQLQVGLNKIAENAPTAIKGKLQESFDSQVLNNTAKYKEKMFSEQRQDEKNNLVNAIGLNTKNALELHTSGDKKGGNSAVESAIEMVNNAVANHYITPEEGRIARETAIQAGLDGTFINKAQKSLKENKYPEFIKKYSETDPKELGMTHEQYMNTGHAIDKQISFLQSLRTQQDKLDIATFNSKVALNPNAITPNEVLALKEKLTPLEFEGVHYDYLKAMKTFSKESRAQTDLMAGFNNPRVFAEHDGKTINKVFRTQVGEAVKQGYDLQDAEVIIAAKAGGVIPEFQRSITNRLQSKDPNQIESAAQQIHALNEMQAGNALTGLPLKDLAMYNGFSAIRDSQDPNKAAQELHERIYNSDSQVVESAWNTQLKNTKPTGTSTHEFGLITAGLSKATFANDGDKILYGNDLLEEYHQYFVASGGDNKIARQMLKDSVSANYGYTHINGMKQMTKHPIEKVLNLPDDALGVIQDDLYNNLEVDFSYNKAMYDRGEVNEYWELTPRRSVSPSNRDYTVQKGLYLETKEASKADLERYKNMTADEIRLEKVNQPLTFSNIRQREGHEPLEVIKHTRKGQSEKYTINIKSNPFASTTEDKDHPINGGWDIAVHSKTSGLSSLRREAPYLGTVTYSPDIDYIKSTYTKRNPLK